MNEIASDNNALLLDSQSTAEAELYVNSTMSSQRITRVETPERNGRKRHLSLPSGQDTSVKKLKRPDESCHDDTSSRRSLYTPDPTLPAPRPAPRNSVVTEAEVHSDGDPSVKQLIAKMSADMHMMFTCLTERIDQLEAGREQHISTKVDQLLGKRVNTELVHIRRDIDTRLDTFKDTLTEEIGDELDDINRKIDSMPYQVPSQTHNNKPDLSLNDTLKVPDVNCYWC